MLLTKPINKPFSHDKRDPSATKGDVKAFTARTLTELEQDFAFFTPAPLLLDGFALINLAQEYINLNSLEGAVAKIPLPLPVFDYDVCNVPQAYLWARTIFACKREYWDGLATHIGGAAVIDRSSGYFSRVITQDIPITDVLAIANLPVLTTIPIVMCTTFTPDSNRRLLVFEPAKNAPVDMPVLVSRDALPETIALSRKERATKPKDEYKHNGNRVIGTGKK